MNKHQIDEPSLDEYTKVQYIETYQKISGCSRSMQGAEMFGLIRSYLSTCRKQHVSASLALELLYKSQLPDILIEEEAE